jgi:hypothetical protein
LQAPTSATGKPVFLFRFSDPARDYRRYGGNLWCIAWRCRFGPVRMRRDLGRIPRRAAGGRESASAAADARRNGGVPSKVTFERSAADGAARARAAPSVSPASASGGRPGGASAGVRSSTSNAVVPHVVALHLGAQHVFGDEFQIDALAQPPAPRTGFCWFARRVFLVLPR